MDRNILYGGENLPILKSLRSNSVDLVYIDPPFNTQTDWVIAYKGGESFDDKFSLKGDQQHLGKVLLAYIEFLAISSNRDAGYAEFMAARILELHRVLKDSGAFFIQCNKDSNYILRVICDHIFGQKNLRNEIIWDRGAAFNRMRKCIPVQETIFYYTKSADFTYNIQYIEGQKPVIERYPKRDDRGAYRLRSVIIPSRNKDPLQRTWRGVTSKKGWEWMLPSYYIKDQYPDIDVKGLSFEDKLLLLEKMGMIVVSKEKRNVYYKQYCDLVAKMQVTSIWGDIARVVDIDYPTQKPAHLLDRIIRMASNEGDIVLDCFCGSGTTLEVAQNLGRRWIGIDSNTDAINVIKQRIKGDMFTETFKFIEAP